MSLVQNNDIAIEETHKKDNQNPDCEILQNNIDTTKNYEHTLPTSSNNSVMDESDKQNQTNSNMNRKFPEKVSEKQIQYNWDDEEDFEEDLISLVKPPSPDATDTTNDLCSSIDCEIIDLDDNEEANENKSKENVKEIESVIETESAVASILQEIQTGQTSPEQTDDLILIDDDDDDIYEVVTSSETEDGNKKEAVQIMKMDIDQEEPQEIEVSTQVIGDSIASQLDNSSIKVNDHGVNKPDVMLEIPLQDVIEFIDDVDITIVSNNTTDVEKTKSTVLLCENNPPKNDIVSNKSPALLEDAIQLSQLPSSSEDVIESISGGTKDYIKAKVFEIPETKSNNSSESTELLDENIKIHITETGNAIIENTEFFTQKENNSSDSLDSKNNMKFPEAIHVTEANEQNISDNTFITPSQQVSDNNIQNIDVEMSQIQDDYSSVLDKEVSSNLDLTTSTDTQNNVTDNQIVESNINNTDKIPIKLNMNEGSSKLNTFYDESKDSIAVKETLHEKENQSTDIINFKSEDLVDSVDNDKSVEKSKEEDNKLLASKSVLEVKTMETSTLEEADLKDAVPEVNDNLDLLAETSRAVEDDEEEDEDDDDFDQDESSNQLAGEHSEDSNPQNSESDVPKEQEDKKSPSDENAFNFAISSPQNDAETDIKDKNIVDLLAEDSTEPSELVATEVNEDIVKNDVEMELPTTEQLATAIVTDGMSETTDNKDEANPLLRSLLQKESSDIQQVTKDVNDDIDIREEEIIDIQMDVDMPSNSEVESESTSPEPSKISKISSPDATLTDPQAKSTTDKTKPKFSLEIFNLDSDEEENAPKQNLKPTKTSDTVKLEKSKHSTKCINVACKSSADTTYLRADAATMVYYEATKKRRNMVCGECAAVAARRALSLIDGIKNMTPLLDLDIVKMSAELVEISDSESDDESMPTSEVKETIGQASARLVEEELRGIFNETWLKYKMDERLSLMQDTLNDKITHLETECKEIDELLKDCQVATDILRNDLYNTFDGGTCAVEPIIIFDTPTNKYICSESVVWAQTEKKATDSDTQAQEESADINASKPVGFTPLGQNYMEPTTQEQEKKPCNSLNIVKSEEDKDIKVLRVSAEVAPSDLPPPGAIIWEPLKPGMCVYAVKSAFGSWVGSKILECQNQCAVPGSTKTFTMCRVKFESATRSSMKVLPARCIAYNKPADVRMTIGTRIIALFKDVNKCKRDAFYAGIVAEVPTPVNSYRYLVFFDDGYAQYVHHANTRLICECSHQIWDDVHPMSRNFVQQYLKAYPERPMVRLHPGQHLKIESQGKWWATRVIRVDASLVQVQFEEDNKTEWIYRGSTRLAPLYLELQAAERRRARAMPRTKAQPRLNMPYVEYTRSEEQKKQPEPPAPSSIEQQKESLRQRAVAKKSTGPMQIQPSPSAPSSVSRVVYYTPKNAVRPYEFVPHTCSPTCKRKDVLALSDLRTYNPLAKPLLSGWEREMTRSKGGIKTVHYRAPCGRRVRNMKDLHKYLRVTQSDMAVDLFDFNSETHCLAEFVVHSCRISKKDLSHGKENVPVPCVNYYDDSLPEFCSYNTERTPTAGVPLNLDPEFLCGCDCTDDCVDKTKCACWKMTLEGAKTIGLDGLDVGYVYRRLPEPLPSGIYECNSRCKCKQTCMNRVAQHPLQLKLQVFKTLNRGWGIRALNDVPKGSFLCVYAGNLLTDATANMDGLNEGDEYLAELDYIEVVEQMKEGFEEDIPEEDKILDKKNQAKAGEEESESEPPSSEEEEVDPNGQDDDDFIPNFSELGVSTSTFSKRLRKRDHKKLDGEKADNEKEKVNEKEKEKEAERKKEDDCITISDDEEVREPSRFTAEPDIASSEFKSKYKSVRAHFGKDEACYIVDAKVQGNIGRYLNHSCCPNVFVQNVFVDTHDPRFPWVAFFALNYIKAGTELTWNYNYDVGSVPGKILYCYCGTTNCRGRLL